MRFYFKKIVPIMTAFTLTIVCLFAAGPSETSASSISVDSYGAKPDGVTDSTSAFQSAINDVINSHGAIKQILLSEGNYALNCSTKNTHVSSLETFPALPNESLYNNAGTLVGYPQSTCLSILGAKSLKITGQGNNKTHIIISNPVTGFVSVSNGSSDIDLEGFSVEYSTPPSTQGVITAIDSTNKTLEVELDAGFRPLRSEERRVGKECRP